MKRKIKRRLAVIMFSDMVGYTSIMQENETLALSNVEQYKLILEQKTKLFDGQVIKYLGDGSIALFDSVYKAVRCALDMQISLQKDPELMIRIAIHTGEVIFSENDFYGDGINITSRLEHMARAGSIVFSRDVYEKIRNHPEFRSLYLGKHSLKNVKEEVDVYAMVHPALKNQYDDIGRETNQGTKLARNRGFFAQKYYRIGAILLLLLCLSLFIVLQIKRNTNRVRLMTELTDLREQHFSSDPNRESSWDIYLRVRSLRQRIHDDPQLEQIWFDFTTLRNIVTSEPGAKIYIKPYTRPDTAWMYIGNTPLYNYRFPKYLTRVRIEKEGFQPQLDVLYQLWNEGDTTFYKLFKPEDIIDGMVFVPGKRGNAQITPGLPYLYIDDFWMDQYEVTNSEYNDFVDAGGYENPDFWKQVFLWEEDTISFDEAMNKFVDRTGYNAPSTWELGEFQEGTGELPVVGISWFEAAAYAEYRQKSLPTLFHWYYVSQSSAGQEMVKFANFNQRTQVKKGTFNSLARFGVFDLAGNVSEWIYNEKSGKRFIMGGNYQEPTYQYISAYVQGSPWTRSNLVGFRCIKPVKSIVDDLKQPIQQISRDYDNLKPISDEEFQVFRKILEHKPIDLDAKIVSSVDHEEWIEQLVLLKVPYDDNPMPVKISIPKNFQPPFQSVVLLPGLGAHHSYSVEDMKRTARISDWIPRIGRVLVQPAFYSSYGRGDINITNLEKWQQTYQFMIEDAQVVCDYIEERQDLDENMIAFFGASWGGAIAPYILAIEKRYKLGILMLFGISPIEKYRLKQFDHVDYVPRVDIPMLLLGGRYDWDYTFEQQQAFYDLLGTPDEHKKWLQFETTHWIPRNELINESRAWMDKYFGEPQPLSNLEE